MTISAVVPDITFAGSSGSGTLGPFSLVKSGTPIVFYNNSEVFVYRYDAVTDTAPTLLVEGTDYTLTGGPTAGSITLTSPQTGLLTAERLYVYTRTSIAQALDLVNGGNFSSSNLERRLDIIFQILQQLDREVKSGIRFAMFDTDEIPKTLPLGAAIDKIPYVTGTASAPVVAYLSATVLADLSELSVEALANIATVAADLAGADTIGIVAAAIDDVEDVGQNIDSVVAVADWLDGGDAGDIEIISTGSTTPRSLAERAALTFDVKDYGALGDNSTDDTAAIQAAIDAAEAASAASGLFTCYVDFPRGVYRYTALTIEVDRVVLRSTAGARLVKTSTTGEGIKFYKAAGRIFSNGIEGLTLGGSGTHTAGSLLNVEQCGQFRMVDLRIDQFPSPVWRGIYMENVSQVTIDRLAVQATLESGVVLEDCIDIYITDSRSDSNASHGWFFDTCAGVYAKGLTAFNNGGNNWRIRQLVGSPILATPGSAFQFYTNCIGDTGGSHNWDIDTLDQAIFTGCWAASQIGTGADLHGFLVTNAIEVDFDGCIATANNSAGLIVTASQIGIHGGYYSENGRVTGSTYRDGIVIGATAKVTMSDVTMTDTESPKTQIHGLRVLSGVTKLHVSNCDMAGNSTGPYTFAAVPTDFFEETNFTDESTSVASASTLALPMFGKAFTITGTTQIDLITSQWNGRAVTLTFAAALTMGDSGVMKLAGNFRTAAGDTINLISDGADWREVSRVYAAGNVVSRSAINNAWQFRNEPDNFHTIADGASLDFAAGSGLILIADNADGTLAAFIAGGAVVTKLGGAAKFVAAAPGAGEVGVVFGATTYRVTNALGSSGTFWISGLAVRNSA